MKLAAILVSQLIGRFKFILGVNVVNNVSREPVKYKDVPPKVGQVRKLNMTLQGIRNSVIRFLFIRLRSIRHSLMIPKLT